MSVKESYKVVVSECDQIGCHNTVEVHQSLGLSWGYLIRSKNWAHEGEALDGETLCTNCKG